MPATSLGQIKNIRHARHGKKEIVTKGDSKVVLIRLFQVGYNVPLTKSILITPYIETVMSTALSGAYQEQEGFYACKVSENKNEIIENSIGIKGSFQPQENSQLQVALYQVLGKQKLHKIVSRTALTSDIEGISWSGSNINKYSKLKIDLSYEIGFSDQLRVGVNSSITVKAKAKHQDKQNISVHLGYMY